MKFGSFVAGLLPSIEKNTIKDDFRINVGIIRELIPTYKVASEYFKPSYNFKSKIVEGMFKEFNRSVPGSQKTPILTILNLIERVVKNEAHIENLIEKYFGEDIAGMGLSYRKANILQLVEGLSFVGNYARKFLNYVYILEAAEYDASDADLGLVDSMSPAEIKWITESYITFLTIFKSLYKDVDNTVKLIDSIPDIEITQDNDDNLARTMGQKIDPLSMRFIPSWLNPIYHIRMVVANYQIARHEQAKEELREIELRKIYLESLTEDKRNAKVEKQLRYINSRSQELNYKIDKMVRETSN